MDIVEFDIRGQVCPSTLLIALKEMNEYIDRLRECSVILSFKTDNRDAVTTIPESAKNMGYETHVVKTEGYYMIEISGARR